jgi:hypothetical protein
MACAFDEFRPAAKFQLGLNQLGECDEKTGSQSDKLTERSDSGAVKKSSKHQHPGSREIPNQKLQTATRLGLKFDA